MLMKDLENDGGSTPDRLKPGTRVHPIAEDLSDHDWSGSDTTCDYEDEDYDDFPDSCDARSIASDDSFYPPDDEEDCTESETVDGPELVSFFRACTGNSALSLKALIRHGVTEEEVRETDKNNRVKPTS